MRTVVVFGASLLLLSSLAFGNDTTVELTDELRAVMKDLMINTKVLAVANLDVPAADYKSDGDPMTLEIVMLSKRADGPSRVSDDGEVIFMQDKTKDKAQQTLFTTAFYLKAKRKLAESQKLSQPAPQLPEPKVSH